MVVHCLLLPIFRFTLGKRERDWEILSFSLKSRPGEVLCLKSVFTFALVFLSIYQQIIQ